jgi:hypothetical protein
MMLHPTQEVEPPANPARFNPLVQQGLAEPVRIPAPIVGQPELRAVMPHAFEGPNHTARPAPGNFRGTAPGHDSLFVLHSCVDPAPRNRYSSWEDFSTRCALGPRSGRERDYDRRIAPPRPCIEHPTGHLPPVTDTDMVPFQASTGAGPDEAGRGISATSSDARAA